MSRLTRPSLLWKIGISTSVAITLLLAIAGYFVQARTQQQLSENLETQLRGNFKAYESLWSARADLLRSLSTVLSGMSDVRAAFQTNDRATIQDTAGEIWKRVSESSAIFLVTDPRGEVIASLGGKFGTPRRLDVVREAIPKFPSQSAGFALQDDGLYEFVVTPVYVQVQTGPELLNVLVTGFPVDQQVALDLRERTGGSDFVFLSMGRVVSSTLNREETTRLAHEYHRSADLQRIGVAGREFAVLGTPLQDISGVPVGDLLIVHNFDAIRRDLNSLQNQLVLIWAAAVVAGMALSVYLAGRILQPIGQLDRAATLIGMQKYDTRVPDGGNDELGRLARTFNDMCRSIQAAREELIRQERIATIGRLSSSIVHDLRNPLASIYGGAEMMMDGDLNQSQLQRIAGNIYKSSRVIKDMLQQLVDVGRGRTEAPEYCNLAEVVGAAVDLQTPAAETQAVDIHCSVDPTIEIPLEPGRMERVFVNLISNAVEAMPDGGEIRIASQRTEGSILITVDDNGPGIPASVRERLFQPFVSSGKNGLGLGLALSRQTVLDHGGDLWIADDPAPGAHFRLRLPA